MGFPGNVNESTNQLEGIQAKTGKPFEVPIIGVMWQLIETAPGSSYLRHSTIAMTEAYVQSKRENRQIAGENLGSLYQPPAQEIGGKLSEKLSEGKSVFEPAFLSKSV